MRHCRNGCPFAGALASGAAFSIGLIAAATVAHPSVLTVVVFAMLLFPLKPAGTSPSPTTASLIVLWDTLAALQLNSIAVSEDSVM